MIEQEPLRLYSFGISHYCEKARWALDWYGASYEEVFWPPGAHRFLARRLGAERSSVPILAVGETLVQGSGKILDWLERGHVDGASLLAHAEREDAAEIERRGDAVVGPAVRRLVYGEMLPKYQAMVKPAFFQGAAPAHRLLGELMWPVTVRLIQKGYRATAETAPQSRVEVEGELDWLDTLLSDGRRFLVGDRFSRVDLTLASLLSAFARPPQMRLYHEMSLPPALAADVERWRERPALRWVNEMYRDHRQARVPTQGD